MGKKSKKNRIGVVYSTNSDFEYETDEFEVESIEPSEQRLKVFRDRKMRKGKVVTLITGYRGPSEELQSLAKLLKQKCGVGGSAKDGEIIIQGDMREKVVKILHGEGFTQAKTAGG